MRERVSVVAAVTPDDREPLLRLAISCCDLTSLEESDTAEKITALARRALRPVPSDPSGQSCAAICTWPRLVAPAAEVVRGSEVRVASVAGDFPSGRAPLATKLAEIRDALAADAQEVDAVIDRGPLAHGSERAVYEEVVAFREAAGKATLKVIIETGALGDLESVRQAALVVMAGGADMVKTSTGKIARGATPEVAVVIAGAIKDFFEVTGRAVGLKVAGGIRRAGDALHYLELVRSELGEAWLDPDRFRIGASSLLDDLGAALSE